MQTEYETKITLYSSESDCVSVLHTMNRVRPCSMLIIFRLEFGDIFFFSQPDFTDHVDITIPRSILIIFRLELLSIFLQPNTSDHANITILSYHFSPGVHAHNSHLLLHHFRYVTPPCHRNNVVTDSCCTGSPLGDTIMQSIPFKPILATQLWSRSLLITYVIINVKVHFGILPHHQHT